MVIGQTISLIFASTFLVLTLIGFIKGYLRGAKRQAVRLATILFSLFSALGATAMLSNFISTLCEGKTIEQLLVSLGINAYLPENVLNILACYDATTAERVLELPLLSIIHPFIFSACFVIISGLTYIVHGVFCFILNFSKKSLKFPSRCGGMFMGLFQGVVVALLFLLPYMNIIGMAGDINDRIAEKHDGDTSNNPFCRIYTEYAQPTRDSLLFTMAYDSFTDSFCDTFSTVDIGGEDVKLRDTLAFMVATVSDFFEFGEFNWVSPTDEQCDSMETMVDELVHNRYIAYVVSGSLRGTALAVDSEFLDFQVAEPVGSVLDALISVFTTLNEDYFAQDVDTVMDVYFIMAREHIIVNLFDGSSDVMSDLFIKKDAEGKTVIKRISATIEENERMSSISKMLTDLTISIMMDNIGVDNGTEVYTNVSTGIKQIAKIDKSDYATDEEYHAAVSEQLKLTLLQNNIQVGDDVVSGMATHYTDNYSDAGELSDDDINDIILSYYQSYEKQSAEDEPVVDAPNGDDETDVDDDYTADDDVLEEEGWEIVDDENIVDDEPIVVEP